MATRTRRTCQGTCFTISAFALRLAASSTKLLAHSCFGDIARKADALDQLSILATGLFVRSLFEADLCTMCREESLQVQQMCSKQPHSLNILPHGRKDDLIKESPVSESRKLQTASNVRSPLRHRAPRRQPPGHRAALREAGCGQCTPAQRRTPQPLRRTPSAPGRGHRSPT